MRALFKNKWLLWFSVICFGVVLLVGLFYIVENWCGARAWAKAQEELKAAGISTRFEDYIPREVPDEENFCRTPVMVALIKIEDNHGIPDVQYQEIHKRFNGLQLTDEHKLLRFGDWQAGEITNLEEWRKILIEHDRSLDHKSSSKVIKQALDQLNPIFLELEQAVKRSHAQFGVIYKDPLFETKLGYLGPTKKMSFFLTLHALAELEDGNSQMAFRDFKIINRFMEALDKEQVLVIHGIYRGALSSLTLNFVWHGFKNRYWQREELAEMQGIFADWNIVDVLRRQVRGDLAILSLDGIDHIRKTAEENLSLFEEKIIKIRYGGWFNDKVFVGDLILEEFRARTIKEFLKWSLNTDDKVSDVPKESILKVVVPSYPKTIKYIATLQSGIDQAETACALERYCMDKGGYPEKLEMLVPEYMESVPLDVMDDKPLRYARTGDGRYKIYSVGLNGVDDGGVRGLVNGKFDMKRAKDWVWSYAGGE